MERGYVRGFDAVAKAEVWERWRGGESQSGHRAYIAECPILTQLGHETALFVAMHEPREVTPAIVVRELGLGVCHVCPREI
jgi:hypothetical protein